MYAYFYCRLRAKASTCFIVLANVKQSLSTQAAHLLFLYAALVVFGFRVTKLCLPATATGETVTCKRETYMLLLYMGSCKFNTQLYAFFSCECGVFSPDQFEPTPGPPIGTILVHNAHLFLEKNFPLIFCRVRASASCVRRRRLVRKW